ncbi:MAG: hypothetical protein LUE22_01515 [Oscillospiraceae bacterium]|nr:hypothetical protein [Oscillospiraceae bacterium]
MADVRAWVKDNRPGDGSGYGSGYGLKTINGQTIYQLDAVATLIDTICGNIAKGRMLNSDLTFASCYIVKQAGYWAHGKTVRDAQADLLDKLFDDMPEDERIAAFWEHFRRGQKYPAMDYFDWHHNLTGSCDMGRRQFARDHDIDLEAAEYTPEEFVELTKNAYGGGIIKKLLEVEA